MYRVEISTIAWDNDQVTVYRLVDEDDFAVLSNTSAKAFEEDCLLMYDFYWLN